MQHKPRHGLPQRPALAQSKINCALAQTMLTDSTAFKYLLRFPASHHWDCLPDTLKLTDWADRPTVATAAALPLVENYRKSYIHAAGTS